MYVLLLLQAGRDQQATPVIEKQLKAAAGFKPDNAEDNGEEQLEFHDRC
jgi:hypothetical protein